MSAAGEKYSTEDLNKVTDLLEQLVRTRRTEGGQALSVVPDIDDDGILTVRGLRVLDAQGRERISLWVDGGNAVIKVEAAQGDSEYASAVVIEGSGNGRAEVLISQGGNIVQTFGGHGVDDCERPKSVTVHADNCPCGFGGNPGHDWFLGIEDRGLAGIVELIGRLELTLDMEAGDDEEVPVWDLNDIVARHNWRQPAVVQRLIRFILDAERSRKGIVDR